jgi:hypothetical protein
MELEPVRATGLVAPGDGATALHHPLESLMGPLVSLGVILIVLWAVLWLGFHIAGWIIHLLIIIGIILLVWGLIQRGARAVDRHT